MIWQEITLHHITLHHSTLHNILIIDLIWFIRHLATGCGPPRWKERVLRYVTHSTVQYSTVQPPMFLPASHCLQQVNHYFFSTSSQYSVVFIHPILFPQIFTWYASIPFHSMTLLFLSDHHWNRRESVIYVLFPFFNISYLDVGSLRSSERRIADSRSWHRWWQRFSFDGRQGNPI